ncbi:MAG: hypothetical protein QGH76_03750 [Phycisphaerales bacterium]|jgi:hypothetical protein|nr:hypothetical protein [Phycisphaerales bacterium]
MFRKLLMTVIACGCAGAMLLSIRQSQINAVAAMASLHQDIGRDEVRLEQLRVRIERRCSPAAMIDTTEDDRDQ